MKNNLTTLTEKQSSTSLFTGNPIGQRISSSPLDDFFNEDRYEEMERFEDDLFEERHMMSQQQFDSRIEDWNDMGFRF